MDAPRPYGAYVLLAPLGRGAMGDVHLARPYDPERGVPTPVVVKRLLPELCGQPVFVERFLHEAKIAVRIDTPHVAKVFDVGRVGDTLYIVTEYISGWTFHELLDALRKHRAPLSLDAVGALITGALRGLSALHQATDPEGRSIEAVHRDISPRNLMVGEDGLARVIDLGLGRSKLQGWKTQTGAVMGSPGYMSPEQARGQVADPRSDLWSLAVILWELLTLEAYIPRGSVPEMLARSAEATYRPALSLRPELPPRLEALLARSLSGEPAQRFASASELEEALTLMLCPDGPHRGTEKLSQSLTRVLGAEGAKRHAREAKLLSLTLPDPHQQEPTLVLSSLAHRSGTSPVDAEWLKRRPAGSLPALAETALAPESQLAMLAKTELDASPRFASTARSARPDRGAPWKRSGVPPGLVVVLLLLVGASSYWLGRAQQEPPRASIEPKLDLGLRAIPARAPPAEPAPERAQPSPAEAPLEIPLPRAPKFRESKPRPETPAQARPRLPGPAPDGAIRTAEARRARAEQLFARARVLSKNGLAPEPAQRLARLMTAIDGERDSLGSLDQAKARLDALARELDGIERSAR